MDAGASTPFAVSAAGDLAPGDTTTKMSIEQATGGLSSSGRVQGGATVVTEQDSCQQQQGIGATVPADSASDESISGKPQKLAAGSNPTSPRLANRQQGNTRGAGTSGTKLPGPRTPDPAVRHQQISSSGNKQGGSNVDVRYNVGPQRALRPIMGGGPRAVSAGRPAHAGSAAQQASGSSQRPIMGAPPAAMGMRRAVSLTPEQVSGK